MNAIFEAWNHQDVSTATAAVLPCCSSHLWAQRLAAGRPYTDEPTLFATADTIWSSLSQQDWGEAFASHPRIGDREAPTATTAQSATWSGQEQRGVATAEAKVQEQVRLGNDIYEKRFGRTYIVCATGKSAEEMLSILQHRLTNNEDEELREAVEQQRQITQLRLRKWLQI